MAISSIGDLARGLALKQQSNLLKQQMGRLTQELSSGQTSDVTRHLDGNLGALADTEHRLKLLETHSGAAEQGRMETEAMQMAIARFQGEAQDLGNTAISFAVSPGSNLVTSAAGAARNALPAMLSALNVSFAGRSLFAGEEVASNAVASIETVMTALRDAAAGAATAADLEAAMDNFFDTGGGGFDTFVYTGGDGARGALPLGEGEALSLDLRADDPAFRDTLKQVAIAALLDDPGIKLDRADQISLARSLGETLLGSQGRIGAIQADLGFAQARVDRASTRISAETTVLNMVRSDLLSIDPFDAASELETVQLRLETLYTLTARMSRLNLVNFLS